ncbi:MAG: NYN domain-containing protein, partial [Longimicrobiaceae bacterium]
MTSFVQRSPHATGAAPASPAARNAALLIDFDNITLGVRSDLGKELRTLLNSEIFSGKVAVRRAYADWRRYPNYVVPLTEASVDLIFAPAYGTSKKNATDLRMAVDAIELAFMRPELGTFILLTGDSDFTSCVVKLKEYGKYVIGVGMRDSSSDLLIQNCDEYYSYHALSGLVREGDQGGSRKDPWLLVREAVQKMAAASDSMRTDRLKQVMIDLDPNFDEKDEGYSKFSKFVQVAAEKGLIRLHKVENGQFEVAPADDEAPLPAPQARYDREDRYRDRDRDRGPRGRGRGRDRDRDRDRGPRPEYPQPAAAEPEREERAEAVPVRLHRDEEEPAAAEVAPYEPAGPPLQEEAPAAPTPEERDARTHAYALLQHAVRALVSRQGQTARDGDVKRRMMEMDPGFDEHALGFSKFSRFLRQAHEDQVVDVRRLAEGRYEVALPSAGTKLAPPTLAPGLRPQPIHVDHEAPAEAADTAAPAEPRGRERDRGRARGRGRGGAEGAPSILPGQTPGAEPARPAEPAQPAAEAPRAEPPPRREPEPEPRRPEPTPPPAVVPVPATPPSGAPAPPRGLGHRNRGRRPAWASPSGP